MRYGRVCECGGVAESLRGDGLDGFVNGPPAGWYPDPDLLGKDRYWTGSEWASQWRESAFPSAPPAHAGVSVPYDPRMDAKVAPDLNPPPKTGLGCFGWCGIGCGAIVLIAIIGSLIAAQNPNASKEDLGPNTMFACEDIVRDNLKSPSSAKFNSTWSKNKVGPWTVTGTVDAENSFGASLRSVYQCTGSINETGGLTTTLDFLE